MFYNFFTRSPPHMIWHWTIIATFAFIVQLVSACDLNCASCKDGIQNGTNCLACNSGYTLIETGLCITESTIPNCATYDQSLNCIACKPTFETIWNICQRMFDGCLIYKNGKCMQCLPGAMLNFMTGSCSVQYLNCIQIDNQGVCLACQPKYALSNGKCVYQSTNCAFLDKNTGLCTQCLTNSVLSGTSCIPNQQVLDNCYMMDDSQPNITCKYCKQGYGVYYGACQTFMHIANLTQNLSENCTNPEYIEVNQLACIPPSISLTNCSIVDFGSMSCVYCQSGYNLINGTCIPMINNFCLTFTANGMACQTCKQTFFLRNGQCNPYPPFCISFTNTCTQCQSNFQLVSGNCVDPNCQTINPITRACQICVVNYKLNPNGVCKFMDPNCQQFNSNGDCLLCMYGYSVKSNLQYCVYQDLNCIAFNNITGNCIMCKPFYAYNEQVQLCVPLPDNCQAADLSGRCSSCMAGFNLISNYNCLFIPSIPNCQMISKDNYTKCVLCKSGSYANANGVCKPLPVFCAVYDSVSNQCQQCNDNGLMRNGVCVDKNCQIFDLDGGCLACIASYQFNGFGQCNFVSKDPNCKNFMFGICQSCMQRYYFNFQFVCTAVSPLCKTYDSNSGYCLSCYDGYQLNVNGGCYLDIYNSVVGNNDILSTSCKTYNRDGECIECYFGYQGIAVSNGSKVVNCVQFYQAGNTYCINIDQSNGKCLSCVSRMFVNSSGACQSIDENCNSYNQTTGSCITCYPGYENTLDPITNSVKCKIVSDVDPNCQTKANGAGCLKCYSGYYYSLENIKCIQVNQLCSTYNSNTGECLSCYQGYTLLQGNCKLSKSSQTISNSSTPSATTTTQMPTGCIQMNSTTNKCRSCDWGYALINGNCLQRDLNCQTFTSADSLTCQTCYNGYKPYGGDQSKCVLATLIIDHCLKYSTNVANLACILCENGYILTQAVAGASPPFTCNIIDQNCAIYNSTANSCQVCIEGTVLSGRVCIAPTYGVDPNCIFYTNKLCTACRAGWALSGYQCVQN